MMNQIEYTWRSLSYESRKAIGLANVRVIFRRHKKYDTAVKYMRIAREHGNTELYQAYKDLIRAMVKSDKHPLF